MSNSQAAVTRIPPELVHMFISNLRGDRHALMACALVHRGQWLASSRQHLFKSLRLFHDNIHGFYSILRSDSNTIARYVRQLGLGLPVGDGLSAYLAFPSLSILSGLEVLSITSGGVSELDSATRSGLSNFANLTKLELRWVRFGTIDDYASLLYSLPLLQSLEVHNIRWSRDIIPHPDNHRILPNWQTMIVRSTSPPSILSWILSHQPERQPEVRTLKLNYISQNIVNTYLQSLINRYIIYISAYIHSLARNI